MTIKELREKRAKLVPRIRELADRQAEWADEDRSNWKTVNDEYDALTAQIEAAEEAETVASRAQALEADMKKPAGDPDAGREDRDGSRPPESREQAPAAIEYRGQNLLEAEGRDGEMLRARNEESYARAFRNLLRGGSFEARALQADLDVQGGYLVPTAMLAGILAAVDNLTFVRELATVLPPLTTADSLGVISLDADPADPTWTAEIKTGDEDSTTAFGKRELRPHPFAERIKLSKTLVRKVPSIVPLVQQRLGYKFAVVEENAFLNGHGAEQPLGVFVASEHGISTDRDCSTDMAVDAITGDGLISCKHTLKSQYWPRSTWLFHSDALAMIRKLKDGEGQYLWQPGLQAGVPDRILERPYKTSEYAPNTFATGLYVGILADWSYYWIVDALTLTIQVLLELYAETNQNGYIGRKETDGMPVLEEAFVRLKTA